MSNTSTEAACLKMMVIKFTHSATKVLVRCTGAYRLESNIAFPFLAVLFVLSETKKISCRLRTRATPCITANVLHTKVDAQCD